LETFWRRMKELGYIEGQNISAEYRFAEGAPASGLGKRTGTPERRRHRRAGLRCRGRQEGDEPHPHRVDVRRPHRSRAGRKSGTSWWERDGVVRFHRGAKRKTVGTSQGGVPATLPGCCHQLGKLRSERRVVEGYEDRGGEAGLNTPTAGAARRR